MAEIENEYSSKTTSKSEMAVVVISYDGYSDLWDDFSTLLNKYWRERPYPTYLVNNVKQANYAGVRVINCGKDTQWSARTRMAIRQIKEPYICLLLEDYFIGDEIDNNKIFEALRLIKQDNLKYYKLNSFSKIKAEKYQEYDYLLTIPENLEYGVSLQAAIWDKQYLLDLVGDGDYNAWKFEVDRSRDSYNASHLPLKGCIYDSRNILNICHGVIQGKILPTAIQYFKDKGYILNSSNREIMSYKEFAYYRLKKIGKQLVPKFVRNTVKKILSELGFKFASTDKKNT